MTDLSSYWGKDVDFVFTVTDQGAKVDLTGHTLRFSAKVKRSDVDPPLVSKSTGAGIVHDPDQVANKGKAILHILAADTNSSRYLDPNRESELEWDLELDLFVIDSGTWTISPSVRRS